MSKLALVRDERFQQHLTPGTHPESPDRLAAINKAFDKNAAEHHIEQLDPRAATLDEIALVHDPSYIEDMERINKRVLDGQLIQLDADTYMSPKTFETAKLAAGAGLVGMESISNGPYSNSFVAVRPPGHHALVSSPMGFCLFNNIAIAARYAQKKLDRRKILIVDWDVHHGNGTQDAFYADPSVCFISLHQYPFYPGTGNYTEAGTGEGRGYNINIPLPKGTGDRGYFHAWDQIVKPISLEYNPDLILLSAGYDAHKDDPLGQQKVTTCGFAMLSQRLLDLSTYTGAKIACFLEGGYNTKSLSESALATMRVLNSGSAEENAAVHVSYLIPGPASGADPITGDQSQSDVDDCVTTVKKHFSQYWKSLR